MKESSKVKLLVFLMIWNLAACHNAPEQTGTTQDVKSPVEQPKEPVAPVTDTIKADTVLVIKKQTPYYRSPAGIRVAKKNGKEFYINSRNCSTPGEIAQAERGDELVVKYTPANNIKEAEWQVVENLTTNSLKNKWLDKQRQH